MPREQRLRRKHPLPALAVLAGIVMGLPAHAEQQELEPRLNQGSEVLEFDWPLIRVGTGEYAEGPTGVTVFHFDQKVLAAIDVRGGGPGTVNSDYLRLGYDYAELDAVVFAGGSWYGLEAATAVASALKDDGIRDGNAFSAEPNIALSVGSIIFDFGGRRLNEIYPDKKLAQAAFRAARPGQFPQGAEGAGRFAISGGLFGCNAYSGQGGAFRQVGEVKIAAFTVVNALGVVTDREGRVAACYGADGQAQDLRTADLLAAYPAKKDTAGERKNTTVSLIVTNQKMDPAELQRLAVQVHTSMARGIQPFATIFDGDVLYAVSTAELEEPVFTSAELGVVASEVMWDAILASVPEQPVAPKPGKITHDASRLRGYAGDYVFSPTAKLRVVAEGQRLYAEATGERDIYAIRRGSRVALEPVSERDFVLPGRYPLVLRFDGTGQVIINPGHWQQVGRSSATGKK